MFYEINLLISPALGEDDAISFVEKLRGDLQIHGKIDGETKPERIKLAYPISDQNDAWLYYFNLHIEDEEIDKKEVLDAVEKTLKKVAMFFVPFLLRKKLNQKRKRRKEFPNH